MSSSARGPSLPPVANLPASSRGSLSARQQAALALPSAAAPTASRRRVIYVGPAIDQAAAALTNELRPRPWASLATDKLPNLVWFDRAAPPSPSG